MQYLFLINCITGKPGKVFSFFKVIFNLFTHCVLLMIHFLRDHSTIHAPLQAPYLKINNPVKYAPSNFFELIRASYPTCFRLQIFKYTVQEKRFILTLEKFNTVFYLEHGFIFNSRYMKLMVITQHEEHYVMYTQP